MATRKLTLLNAEEFGLTFTSKRQWYFKMRTDFFCDYRIMSITGDALRVFMLLISQSLRQNNVTITVSEEFISTQTRLKEDQIKLLLRELKMNNLIDLQTNVRIQLIEENRIEENRIERIQISEPSVPVAKGDAEDVSDSSGQKKKTIVPDVIKYLNEKTGKAYKTSSQSSKKLIQARINDGYNLDDFKHVIDVKTDQWLTDSRMSGYLRPKTLFSPKFEDYLQEKIQGDPLEEFFLTEIEKHGLDLADFKA